MVTNNAWNSQDPAQVPLGGTGAATLTGSLLGNGTGAITGLTGNSIVIASNAAGTISARSFSVVEQVFTSGGTYTPTTGMLYCFVRMVGGGGGSGGVATTGVGTSAVSGSGGAGEYAEGVFSATTIGTSQTVSIGAAGAAGASGNNTGGTGGNTSLGALMSAHGATGGSGSSANAAGTILGGTGGTGGTGGSIRFQGQTGGYGFYNQTFGTFTSVGGSTPFGSGGLTNPTTSGVGTPGTGFGSGGSGSVNGNSMSAQPGAAGTAGIVVILEYVIA